MKFSLFVRLQTVLVFKDITYAVEALEELDGRSMTHSLVYKYTKSGECIATTPAHAHAHTQHTPPATSQQATESEPKVAPLARERRSGTKYVQLAVVVDAFTNSRHGADTMNYVITVINQVSVFFQVQLWVIFLSFSFSSFFSAERNLTPLVCVVCVCAVPRVQQQCAAAAVLAHLCLERRCRGEQHIVCLCSSSPPFFLTP